MVAEPSTETLRIAIVDLVHRMHKEPQYMLCRGVLMNAGGAGFGVGFRAADGTWHEVRATDAELNAVALAEDAEEARWCRMEGDTDG